MGRKLKIWMLLAAALFFTAVMPRQAQAETDPVEVTVKLDACKGHEAIAKAIAGQEYEQTGTVVTIPLRHSELYPDDGYSTNGSMQLAAMVLSNKVRSAFEDPDTGFEDVIDNGEHLVYLGYNYIVGLREMQRYSAWDEINSDFSNDPVSEGQMFYLLWEIPTKSVTVSVKPPLCGTEINRQIAYGNPTSFYTEPGPEIEVTGSATISLGHAFYSSYNYDAVWIDNKDGYLGQYYGDGTGNGYLNDVTVKGGNPYYVYFQLDCDFGYFTGTKENNHITVNGKAPVTIKGSAVVAEITAEHVPKGDIKTTPATCVKAGKTEDTCTVCGDVITETIPALGHTWKFSGFTWTGNEKNGYTKAAAEYVCENDKTHKKTVEAEIKETVTAPGCETKGKSAFKASVSAKKSLDGKAHSESKEGKPTEATGHTWKAPVFTWTKDGKGGYSGAEAVFVCKNDSAHKIAVKAAVASQKVKSKCDAEGMTLYTATFSAKDCPDGKEYTDQAGAEITDPTGHTWEFVGFTWTGNKAKGYTKATANYVCSRDPLHKYSVDAVITEEVTEPTKEKDGKTVYTAAVSEKDSPDGKAYSAQKDATRTTASDEPEKKPEEQTAEKKISGRLFAKMTAKGKTSLKITWNKIKGAEGYDIFLGKCNKKTAAKKIKTITGNKTFRYTKKKLKKATAYKVSVKAWIEKDGRKEYVKTSQTVHAYTAGGNAKYTNTKGVKLKKSKITLKVGKKKTIKATVIKLKKGKKISKHMSKLTYKSSNSKIASVSKNGTIKAKKAGRCKIYVIAANGAKKTVRVTVKQKS